MPIKSTNSKANRYKVSWQEYDKDIKLLARKLKDLKITAIYPILRGGLTIGHHLSNLLCDIKITPESQGITRGVLLIIDDVSDSGKTLIKITNDFRKRNIKFLTATLYIKSHTKFIPDYYIKTINKWIVYPWEKQ